MGYNALSYSLNTSFWLHSIWADLLIPHCYSDLSNEVEWLTGDSFCAHRVEEEETGLVKKVPRKAMFVEEGSKSWSAWGLWESSADLPDEHSH